MAQQPQTEGRITRRIGLARPRRQGPHQPARRRRARSRLGSDPQQQGHDAGRLGRQSEAPAGGQIELARLAPGLDQRRAESRTAGRLGPGAQDALGIAGPHQQHLCRVEAELGETGRVQPAGLGRQEILPDPEQRPRPRSPQGQGRGEAGRGGQIGPSRGIDLVQGCPGDAAAQRLIQLRHAEADALHRRELARQARQSEALPEAGQGAGRSVGHGKMFTICSDTKPLPNPAGVKPGYAARSLPERRGAAGIAFQPAQLSPIPAFLSYQGNADRLAATQVRQPPPFRGQR